MDASELVLGVRGDLVLHHVVSISVGDSVLLMHLAVVLTHFVCFARSDTLVYFLVLLWSDGPLLTLARGWLGVFGASSGALDSTLGA